MLSKFTATLLTLTLVIFFNSSSVQAAELAGQNFPDKIKLADKELTLNGLGLRTATIFSIKVYVAGLYLETKSSDAEAIITSSQNKKLEMRFLREVSRAKIRRAWIDGFEANNENLNPIRDRITQFSAAMQTLKTSDVLTLDFIADKTLVSINGSQVAEILGVDFSNALLKIWLGKNPPNEALKKGLLNVQ